jgi:D-alanyl-D-alanine dipeptidase
MKFVVFLLLLLTSCANEAPIYSNDKLVIRDEIIIDSIVKELTLLAHTDSVFRELDLVDIFSINSSIQVDLKYASEDNFMGVILYDTLKRVYLNRTVALRLSKCQDYLDSIRPGYSLLVYDGVRPLLVQKEMWEALDSIPTSRRGKFVSNPLRGSVHNFGAAVDLTIIDSLGKILDMGAGYDDFNKIAFPSLESLYLKSGQLTRVQVNNRQLLRKVMHSQRFSGIPSEWWHFNAYSRVTASQKFSRLLTESGKADFNKLVPLIKDSLIVVDTIKF